MQANLKEFSKYWTAEDLSSVALLRARFVKQQFARHTHEHFVIGVNESGVESFYCRGAQRIAPAGSIVIINPLEVHTGHSAGSEAWSYRGIYPEADTLADVASQIEGRKREIPFFPSPVVKDPPLAAVLANLHQTLESSPETLARQSLFIDALTELIVRHADARIVSPPARREKSVVRLVCDYIQSFYQTNITLKELAKLTEVSSFHLLRTFRAEMGMPPHQYLLQVRVERGKNLLAKKWAIADAAAETGFVDQSHFTRRFKIIYGITPGQFIQAGI